MLCEAAEASQHPPATMQRPMQWAHSPALGARAACQPRGSDFCSRGQAGAGRKDAQRQQHGRAWRGGSGRAGRCGNCSSSIGAGSRFSIDAGVGSEQLDGLGQWAAQSAQLVPGGSDCSTAAVTAAAGVCGNLLGPSRPARGRGSTTQPSQQAISAGSPRHVPCPGHQRHASPPGH